MLILSTLGTSDCLCRHEAEELGYGIPPELGLLLPPKSTRSWFLKYDNKGLAIAIIIFEVLLSMFPLRVS